MPHPHSDPLVTMLRIILAFIMGVVALAFVIVALGFVAVPFFQADLARELAGKSSGLSPWTAILMIEAVLAGVLGLLALVEYFFVQLWRVLGSIRDGDPFVPANSDRISRMAWVALAGNLWAVALTAYGAWFESNFPDDLLEAELHFDVGGGGAILILVLFVLARVFRQGTAMREDLERTV